ncbi:5-oxoprolinase subunit PxpA [Nocardioides sp. GY 10127]|uniref:5-oxoprolinase subunit PxpA n=1 Tax=Nocardioides sp. GY 10127 TaxID=2569762 RepID=UPI0010A7A1C2|nr:5-oxoprolinase subunit PxpA [Nocardioides sp. GY 10127]TIC85430.1 LamB/YcsF family protein [Nocardioides sp. GY 10127]
MAATDLSGPFDGEGARPGAPGPAAVVDLNADLGEEVTDDEALLDVVTSANVACGFHAGSPAIMRAVCEGAAARGVSVGAQVSYADREHFGRRALDVPYAVLRAQVAEQVTALADAAAQAGTVVAYLKPHGALYHRTRTDPEQADAVWSGWEDAGHGARPVLGMRGELLDLAAARGAGVLLEGFPDRAYTPDGSLVDRSLPGAVLTDGDEIARRAVALAATVDSVCVHGDHPGAVAHARAVRAALEGSGWTLRGL